MVGSTGSGKTFFAVRGLMQYLRLQYPQAHRYIIDSSYDDGILEGLGDALVAEGNIPPALLRSPVQTLVWRPANSIITESYARFLNKLNDSRQPFILIIDEIASLKGEAVEQLEVLLKQCRKHGGTVICLTQEISKVDLTIFRQMSHYAQFFINAEPYDLARSRSYLAMTKEEQSPPRDPYGFFYRDTRNGGRRWAYYPELRAFFGGSLKLRKKG